VIAKQSREGWFQSRIPAGYRFGTTPALRATPPDSGGETSLSLLNSFTPSMPALTGNRSQGTRCVRFFLEDTPSILLRKREYPDHAGTERNVGVR
jgi:hypothetical protein